MHLQIYAAKLSGGQADDCEVIVRVAFDIPNFRNTRKMESEVCRSGCNLGRGFDVSFAIGGSTPLGSDENIYPSTSCAIF
jgi:hypothetical protein